MKIKLLSIIASFLITLAMTSCLDNEEKMEYSNDATIRSFSINDIKTIIISENDTTDFTVKGKNYPFSISQLPSEGKIYNTDSLPYRTDIKKVSVRITNSSGYITYKKNDKDTIWTSADSLDFTNPIVFTVHAQDGYARKSYQVKINVHQVNPDSLVWNKIESNFPGTSISGKQKAVLLNGTIYVFADNTAQVSVTYTKSGEAHWSNLEQINIPTKADYSSVITFNNKLYITAGGEVYSSDNGTEWVKENANASVFVCSFTKKLIGINNNSFVEAKIINGVVTWENTEKSLPDNFPKKLYSSVTYPLTTNESIEKAVMISEDTNPSDSSTVVWSTFSDKTDWIDFTTASQYDCPKLENISLIRYDNRLFVFGGKGTDNGKEVKAFQSFYASDDNGTTWKIITENILFPNEFIGKDDSFSYIVDNDNYIWIMWSRSNIIWKGKINHLRN